MYSNMRSIGIEGWIPKQHFNNATQILPARKRLNVNVQNRSSTTRNDYAERPTKQVKVSPMSIRLPESQGLGVDSIRLPDSHGLRVDSITEYR